VERHSSILLWIIGERRKRDVNTAHIRRIISIRESAGLKRNWRLQNEYLPMQMWEDI
jgi:hypothetical protein